ncbi:hypothetical protein BaRGS_00020739 [Batillaria attramentaria]|uniref:Uncharacterized protein n=1 Tax=Batillaria attramentaria TaxID=370345 RepID=A0ABD0KLF7_9CAEN
MRGVSWCLVVSPKDPPFLPPPLPPPSLFPSCYSTFLLRRKQDLYHQDIDSATSVTRLVRFKLNFGPEHVKTTFRRSTQLETVWLVGGLPFTVSDEMA